MVSSRICRGGGHPVGLLTRVWCQVGAKKVPKKGRFLRSRAKACASMKTIKPSNHQHWRAVQSGDPNGIDSLRSPCGSLSRVARLELRSNSPLAIPFCESDPNGIEATPHPLSEIAPPAVWGCGSRVAVTLTGLRPRPILCPKLRPPAVCRCGSLSTKVTLTGFEPVLPP